MYEDNEGPVKHKIAAKRVLVDYVAREYDIDINNQKNAALLDQQIKFWLRAHGRSVGRIKGTGWFRHETWYVIGNHTFNDTQIKYLASQTVKLVYGDSSAEYLKVAPEIKNIQLGVVDAN
jgi:hypothetical protein